MPNGEEGNELEFSRKISRLFVVTVASTIVLATISAIIVFAALSSLVIALIVLGAAALLLLIGAVAFRNFTCVIKAQYAANAARAAAIYGFPTYAALKASWPFLVRLVAC